MNIKKRLKHLIRAAQVSVQKAGQAVIYKISSSISMISVTTTLKSHI